MRSYLHLPLQGIKEKAIPLLLCSRHQNNIFIQAKHEILSTIISCLPRWRRLPTQSGTPCMYLVHCRNRHRYMFALFPHASPRYIQVFHHNNFRFYVADKCVSLLQPSPYRIILRKGLCALFMQNQFHIAKCTTYMEMATFKETVLYVRHFNLSILSRKPPLPFAFTNIYSESTSVGVIWKNCFDPFLKHSHVSEEDPQVDEIQVSPTNRDTCKLLLVLNQNLHIFTANRAIEQKLSFRDQKLKID